MSSVPAPPVDFGKAAQAYAQHRQGFPAELFERLERLGVGFPQRTALDLGTGTGLFARDMARRGANVTGLDPSSELLQEAKRANAGETRPVFYALGIAEDPGLPSYEFDIVSAATCWHWFDRERAASEAARLLKPDGVLLICHLDWWRGPSGVVELTADVTSRFHSKTHGMTAANTFQHPSWLADLRKAGFLRVETFGFTTALRYTQDAWVGRVRASASIGPVLPPAELAEFERVFAAELKGRYGSADLDVEHLVFAVVAWKN